MKSEARNVIIINNEQKTIISDSLLSDMGFEQGMGEALIPKAAAV